MADLKISSLPASTTPLAGTEVVPLVQSGTTKKVTVADLTAGRAVSALSFTGGAMKISSNALETITSNGDYTLTPNGTGRVVIGGAASAFAWAGAATEIRTGFRVYDSASSSYGLRVGFSGNVPFLQGFRETVGVIDLNLQKDGGNVSIGNGNLVIGTAGKGIDFSADSSAAGMTSELLDDYEEGTWTPTVAGDATGVINTASGQYTKIGNVVYFRCVFGVTTNFTANSIGGLPFTCVVNNAFTSLMGGSIVLTSSIIGAPIVATPLNGNTNINFYEGASTGTAHLPNSVNASYRINGFYFT
jgi:hypothetical protein